MASHAHKKTFSPIIPAEEEEKRREITEYAINSMWLEGVTLDKQTLDNVEAYNRGDLTRKAFLKRGLEIAMAIDKNQKA